MEGGQTPRAWLKSHPNRIIGFRSVPTPLCIDVCRELGCPLSPMFRAYTAAQPWARMGQCHVVPCYSLMEPLGPDMREKWAEAERERKRASTR